MDQKKCQTTFKIQNSFKMSGGEVSKLFLTAEYIAQALLAMEGQLQLLNFFVLEQKCPWGLGLIVSVWDLPREWMGHTSSVFGGWWRLTLGLYLISLSGIIPLLSFLAAMLFLPWSHVTMSWIPWHHELN